jgi:hypothetical protein
MEGIMKIVNFAAVSIAVLLGIAVILNTWQLFNNNQQKQVNLNSQPTIINSSSSSSSSQQKSVVVASQAQHISAWITGQKDDSNGMYLTCKLYNASDTPVYDVVITPVFVQGAGPTKSEDVWKQNLSGHMYGGVTGILPPGKFQTGIPFGGNIPSGQIGLEIAFTDASGNSWIVRSKGVINQITKDPFKYYQVPMPASYLILAEVN